MNSASIEMQMTNPIVMTKLLYFVEHQGYLAALARSMGWHHVRNQDEIYEYKKRQSSASTFELKAMYNQQSIPISTRLRQPRN
jgi:hypothetical protein